MWISELERALRKAATQGKITRRLLQIPGIGPNKAMAIETFRHEAKRETGLSLQVREDQPQGTKADVGGEPRIAIIISNYRNNATIECAPAPELLGQPQLDTHLDREPLAIL